MKTSPDKILYVEDNPNHLKRFVSYLGMDSQDKGFVDVIERFD